jgi:hypothetical protein
VCLKIPVVGWLARRRQHALLRAERTAARHEAAERSAAVERILAQAPQIRDQWRRYL